MNEKFNALKINESDNVAVALRSIKAGELLYIQNQKEEVRVSENIQYGHKVAIVEIPLNGKVIKYGECMGIATENISVGKHVHVTNIRGLTEEDKMNTIYGRGCEI